MRSILMTTLMCSTVYAEFVVDGAGFIDTNSGLKWQDPIVNIDADLRDNFMAESDQWFGYRYATTDDIETLLLNAGVSLGTTSPADQNGLDLGALFGWGVSYGDFDTAGVHGWHQSGRFDIVWQEMGDRSLEISMTENGRRIRLPEFGGNAHERHIIVSGPKPLPNFGLVQPEMRDTGMAPAVVPEPSSVALWIIGVFLMGVRHWKR